MSFSIKQFVKGIGLKPVSADPSNPTQGQLQYADGTVRAEGLWRYDGTAWQQVGSGAGSYDIFYQEDFETNSASAFTSGNNAAPDAVGTGTLDGTLANETSSQIADTQSLKYTMGSTSANDFFLNDTDIALDVKQQGQFIGISFYYTYNGDDDDIRFFVLDQDDNEITESTEYLKNATGATRFSTSIYVPSSDTGLRYGFQVVTGNSAKILLVDEIEFSTNPFVYKNLAQENEFSARIANNGTATITSQGGENSQGQNAIASVNRTSPGVVDITFTSGFFSVIPSVTLGVEEPTRTSTRITAISTSSMTVETYSNNTGNSADYDFTVHINRQGSDYKRQQEHVITPAKSTLTNWESYTPSNTQGFGAATTDLRYRRIGSCLEISGTVTAGTVTTSEAQIELPTGFTIKTGNSLRVVGSYGYGATAAANGGFVLATGGDTYLNFGTRYSFYDTSINPLTPASGASGTSSVTATGKDISFTCMVEVDELSADATFLAAIPVPLTAYIEDQKTASTAGGTFTSGAWRTRDLNTIEGDSSFVMLSSNEFTLGAGTYYIEWDAPAYDCSVHQSRLYDVTGAASLKRGTQMDTEVSANVHNVSSGYAKVVLTSSNTYRIEHRCTTTKTTTGFGIADTFSEGGLFTRVKVTKIK